MRRFVAVLVFLAGLMVAVWAQDATDLHFEVASIKPNRDVSTAMNGIIGSVVNGRCAPINFSLQFLIADAFDVGWEKNRVVGLPDWAATAKYDIDARTDIKSASKAQYRALLRNLLIDRFQLRAHLEKRPLPVYDLVLARADGTLGPNLRPFAGDCNEMRVQGSPCTWRAGGNHAFAVGQEFRYLYQGTLPSYVDRRVNDRTGLTGLFNWDLDLSVEPGDTTRPSVFTALQEQLGLKLVPATAPLDVVVIDHIEPPTPN